MVEGYIFEDADVEELVEDEAAGGDGRPAVVVEVVVGGGRCIEVEREADGGGGRRREVGLGLGAAEGAGGAVVCHGGLLGGVKGAKPDTCLLPGIANLGGVSPPWPLPHSPVVTLTRSSRHWGRRR